MKMFLSSIFLFLMSFQSFSQKSLMKEFSAEGIAAISIRADEVFNIEITSSITDQIEILAQVEGEYFENVTLPVTQENDVLNITTSYSPYFEKDNDKLSAHKLIAIELKITIPENFSVSIISKIASVVGSGRYKNFSVGLDSGNCTLVHFLGNGNLQTKQGFIAVSAKIGVTADCISKHGEIKNQLPKSGKYLIKAESIEGDITLSRTE